MEGLHTGENIGGVLEIAVCLIDDVLSMGDEVRFKPNKWWTVIEVIPHTATFVDEEVDTDQGILYNYSGALRRQYPSKSDEVIFSAFVGQCVIMRIVDRNGICRVLGSPECPVAISRSGNRGSKPSDLSYHEFKYSVSQSFRAL